jgi:hypothetical protein
MLSKSIKYIFKYGLFISYQQKLLLTNNLALNYIFNIETAVMIVLPNKYVLRSSNYHVSYANI